MEDVYQYDLCISYASEQIDYVKETYQHLVDNSNLKIFFDQSLQSEALGMELKEKLYSVFNKESKYCLLFSSKEYKVKKWTKFELDKISDRALSDDDYVILVTFDDTIIPILKLNQHYIDANEITPKDLSNLLIDKLCLKSVDSKSELFAEIDIYEKIILEVSNYIRDTFKISGFEYKSYRDSNSFMIKGESHGNTFFFFKIRMSQTSNVKLYIWLFSYEPNDQENSYNGILLANEIRLTDGYIKFSLDNRGLFSVDFPSSEIIFKNATDFINRLIKEIAILIAGGI